MPFLLHFPLQFLQCLDLDHTVAVTEKLGAVAELPAGAEISHGVAKDEDGFLSGEEHVGEFPLAVNLDRPLNFEAQAEVFEGAANLFQLGADFADEVVAVVENPIGKGRLRTENVDFGGKIKTKLLELGEASLFLLLVSLFLALEGRINIFSPYNPY